LSPPRVRAGVCGSTKEGGRVAGNSIAVAQYQDDKVTICHVTGSGEGTITVAAAAVPAHLRHGDTVGAC
jgi:hypothetical protein